MNLISETHHSCERKEYAFIVLQKYTIIFPHNNSYIKVSWYTWYYFYCYVVWDWWVHDRNPIFYSQKVIIIIIEEYYVSHLRYCVYVLLITYNVLVLLLIELLLYHILVYSSLKLCTYVRFVKYELNSILKKIL